MKKILLGLLVVSFAAKAQVSNYDYIAFCDKIVVNVNNSVPCIQLFYNDLNEFKKNPDFRFRYYESYNCIQQPDQKSFDRVKPGTNVFYKPIAGNLWKLYNDYYAKGGEITVFLRLQDYKTDLDKGFRLIRELQQIQNAIGDARHKIAGKIYTDSKSLGPGPLTKPYQLFLNAIVHEEELIQKFSLNFNEGIFTGFPQEEILKSYLTTDELLKNLKPSNFKIPDIAPLRSCYEGLQLIQQTKQTALDDFNNTSTFDGQHANELYKNLLTYFSSDILYFFAYMSAEGSNNGVPLSYYPAAVREYDLDTSPKPWVAKHLEYSTPSLDSVAIIKSSTPMPVVGFSELNLTINYINECVFSMENLYTALRSEEYTWDNLHRGKMPYKNPVIKFDKFMVPLSAYGLVNKNGKDLPSAYRPALMKRVDNLQEIMITMQDHVFGLSQYMSSGTFRGKDTAFIDSELETIKQLYIAFDLHKEILYKEIRKVYAAYPPARNNSWTTASNALLKASDDSRKVLRQMELRLYEKKEISVSTAAIHEDQRDLITNELKYMKGIVELGKYNGNCPYTPYEYIPDYLKTLEEKVQSVHGEVKDEEKTYEDLMRMHNLVIEQYNKFAELGLGDNEYGKKDPARPMYLLSNIYQLMKYYYKPPEPEIKKEEPVVMQQAPVEISPAPITFEGYPFNNMVLLLDVSSSMNVPERLPRLKKSFEQLIKLMRKEDEVSIVVYSGKARVLLSPTSASDTSKIIQSIQNLTSDGKTNIADGLNLAYKTARKNFKSDGNNRIILATDGEFNLGEPLYELAENNAGEIPLSVFDFSQGPDAIKSIQSLAERGKGNYVKVTAENALEVLAGEARKK